MPRSRPLRLECLEDRFAPANFGVPWPDPTRLTLSLAPDGTSVMGPATSRLFELLDAQMPRGVWQREILRAFQSWAVQANINIGWVADGGQPFGTGGAIEGDARFGDIRIGTYPLAPDVVAVSLPFDVSAGTWSGDVKLNVGCYASADACYDLCSVLLHEAGHVFGLDHATDPNSALFPTYDGTRNGLTGEDIVRLRALYGERESDTWEGKKGNDEFATATHLKVKDGPIIGDLTTGADVDHFKLDFSPADGTASVRLRTAGLSLLAPKLTVYEVASAKADPVAVGSAETADPMQQGDLLVTLNSLLPGATYFVRVEAAGGDVFGIGSYQLKVETDTTPAGEPSKKAFIQVASDLHDNDTRATAVNLLQKINRLDTRFDYTYWADLTDGKDVDFYRFKAPNPSQAAGKSTLTAMVWTGGSSSWQPQLALFDAEGSALNPEVLVRENGTVTVQLAEAPLCSTYYLAVRAGESAGLGVDADPYFLGIDFGAPEVRLDTLVAAQTLTEPGLTHTSSLHVEQSQLFHVVLSATGGGTGTAIALTVLDSDKNEIFTRTINAGELNSATLYLPQGDYTFKVEPVAAPGSTFAPVTYSLRAIGLSDPIGPHPVNTTVQPGAATYFWQMGFYGLLNPPIPEPVPAGPPPLVDAVVSSDPAPPDAASSAGAALSSAQASLPFGSFASPASSASAGTAGSFLDSATAPDGSSQTSVRTLLVTSIQAGTAAGATVGDARAASAADNGLSSAPTLMAIVDGTYPPSLLVAPALYGLSSSQQYSILGQLPWRTYTASGGTAGLVQTSGSPNGEQISDNSASPWTTADHAGGDESHLFVLGGHPVAPIGPPLHAHVALLASRRLDPRQAFPTVSASDEAFAAESSRRWPTNSSGVQASAPSTTVDALLVAWLFCVLLRDRHPLDPIAASGIGFFS